MYKFSAIFILFIFLTLPLYSKNSKAEYSTLSKEYHQFFQKKRSRSEWLNLIKKFESHGKKYRKQKISAKSFYNVATLSFKVYQISHRQSDLNKSIKYYTLLCKNYGSSSLSDDACSFLYKLYHKKRKNHEKSKYYAKYILDHYPKSDSYKGAIEFIKKNYPLLLEKKTNKSIPHKIKKNKFVTLELFKNSVHLISTSSKNEGAKIGEVKVDGELTKVFIDFKKESFVRVKPIPVHSFIKKIRFGQNKIDVARMVIELDHSVSYKVLDRGKQLSLSFFNLKKKHDIAPKELIQPEKAKQTEKQKAQVEKKETTTSPKEVKNIKKKESKTVALVKNNNKQTKKASAKRKYTIIVDAGHGGKDPGAQSQNKKHLEKDITLKVALKLAKKLRKNPKYKVILTRKSDKYLTLDQRTDIANDNKGDIFISLHINAIRNRRFYGIETFYLNIAADNYSRRLESVENAENQKKITDLQFILADLLKKANTKESIDLSKFVQQSLIHNLRRKYKKVRNLGVKNAMFYVLLDTKMPSILVELGFISNKSEVKRLVNDKYQERLADSIVKGVDKFFTKYKKKNN